jgi:hypothetical protein
MYLYKKNILIIIAIVLLVLNIFMGVFYIKQRNISNEFMMSSVSWASIAGNYKAELDYDKGILEENPQSPEAVNEDFDIVAWREYINSYHRKYKKLSERVNQRGSDMLCRKAH